MPTCKGCDDEVETLVSVKVDGKTKKLCEDCADRARESNEIAEQSDGALYDSTEIDEILTLRIMTLTDEEKREAAAVDERARALLERTEALGAKELLGLHGTMRGRRG